MPRKRKMPDSELGYRLMQMRLGKNMSVEGLGGKFGRGKATISRYEHDGKIDAETILVYCREFNVDPNYLLGWEKSVNITEDQFMNLLMTLGKELWSELKK